MIRRTLEERQRLRDRRRAEQIKRSRKNYAEKRAAGLCTRNASHGPTGGGVHCAACKVDANDVRRDQYARTRGTVHPYTCSGCGEQGHRVTKCHHATADGGKAES
jgi:hypothetical protein